MLHLWQQSHAVRTGPKPPCLSTRKPSMLCARSGCLICLEHLYRGIVTMHLNLTSTSCVCACMCNACVAHPDMLPGYSTGKACMHGVPPLCLCAYVRELPIMHRYRVGRKGSRKPKGGGVLLVGCLHQRISPPLCWGQGHLRSDLQGGMTWSL